MAGRHMLQKFSQTTASRTYILIICVQLSLSLSLSVCVCVCTAQCTHSAMLACLGAGYVCNLQDIRPQHTTFRKASMSLMGQER